MKKQVMKKICAVYKITNVVTGEFYIGSSVDVKKRWQYHKSPSHHRLKPNNRLYQDMDEYGLDSFQFEILCECDEKELHDMEQWYIDWEKPAYNQIRATGHDIERYKAYQKVWKQTEKGKASRKAYNQSERGKACQKAYDNQLCNFNSEVLTLCALRKRFRRQGIPNPTAEAKKYLIQG